MFEFLLHWLIEQATPDRPELTVEEQAVSRPHARNVDVMFGIEGHPQFETSMEICNLEHPFDRFSIWRSIEVIPRTGSARPYYESHARKLFIRNGLHKENTSFLFFDMPDLICSHKANDAMCIFHKELNCHDFQSSLDTFMTDKNLRPLHD